MIDENAKKEREPIVSAQAAQASMRFDKLSKNDAFGGKPSSYPTTLELEDKNKKARQEVFANEKKIVKGEAWRGEPARVSPISGGFSDNRSVQDSSGPQTMKPEIYRTADTATSKTVVFEPPRQQAIFDAGKGN